MEIKKGESIVFSGGVSSVDTAALQKTFADEMEERTPRNDFKHCLINAAHQFLNRQGDESYILAGYPWFKCRARDMFISLPGLTLSVDEVAKYEQVMETAGKAIEQFIHDGEVTLKVYEMEHPDVLLWAVWCIQQYAKMVGRDQCRQHYSGLLKDIIEYILNGGHPNLFLHTNGLLYTNGTDRAVTWMNATANGRPVTPRTGYVVEINALWYNALCFIADLFGEVGDDTLAVSLRQQAEKVKTSFVSTFLNEYGYLLDYVDGNMMDWSVRPNQIFTVAFDYSPLDAKQKKGVLDIVTKELLTPKGLRSLSPKSGGYNPNYVGPQAQRDYAYHQGTAWPWLAGFYFEAYLRIYKMSALGYIDRQMIGYEDEMQSHCIGSIPELFDGNPPFRGRGAVSFAMNVAEILRVLYRQDKYTY
jgi:predicted glycogen debranching enzyme